jgi:hypothetical protein
MPTRQRNSGENVGELWPLELGDRRGEELSNSVRVSLAQVGRKMRKDDVLYGHSGVSHRTVAGTRVVIFPVASTRRSPH